jgi:small GTP-binding protein
MLGDTNTGKTSLVLRFAEGYYREEARSATVGAFFITKRLQVQGITCKIQIWDTAGQEQVSTYIVMLWRELGLLRKSF